MRRAPLGSTGYTDRARPQVLYYLCSCLSNPVVVIVVIVEVIDVAIVKYPKVSIFIYDFEATFNRIEREDVDKLDVLQRHLNYSCAGAAKPNIPPRFITDANGLDWPLNIENIISFSMLMLPKKSPPSSPSPRIELQISIGIILPKG